MKIFFRWVYAVMAGLILMLTTVSCNEDLTTIGDGILADDPFKTNRAVYDVFVFNKNINAVETNKLPIYQIGTYNDLLYGNTEASITSQLRLQGGVGNPAFGLFSQQREDNSLNDPDETAIEENETVKEVILYIPFLQNPNGDRDLDGVADTFDADPEDPNSDSDGDGLTDNDERILGTNPLNVDTDGDGIEDFEDTDYVVNRFPRKVDLDSIYGNREVPFNFKVERSTYFLRDLDADAGFLESQEYYSTQEFSPDFVSDILFDGEVTISDEEILVPAEDDPGTEADESLNEPTRIQPGIQVALDPTFFQDNILDKEGDTELLSQANFSEFLRGLHMSATPITDDILLILDITDATITINYEYNKKEGEGIVKEEADYELSLITRDLTFGTIIGNAVNTLVNAPFSSEIANALDTNENADRIYLKGGSGAYAEIQLFEENNGEDILNQIKTNNWIVNEANLIFYVDREALDMAGNVNEPPSLYLFNTETNNPIYDLSVVSDPDVRNRININYGGSLEKENDKGVRYKMKITNHINDIIIRDSANVTLGLAVTADLASTNSKNAVLDISEEDLPVAATITPLSTVLFGSNVPAEEEDMQLKLEIFYTEPN
ncbi:DUF4270 domain-containing protein [Eudoraea adriatica]|uniref:DUF4270 domain-containing protein n=1 Tax=Eudoraea adriatica TaxID=446681 RepID=UPI00036421DE|nr:DUF4270 domain-containing protein [Eudoraea adriatica]